MLLAPLVLLGVARVASTRVTPRPTAPPTQAYSPPPREDSPFSESDVFCAPSENRFPSVALKDPRLRVPVSVVMLLPLHSDTATLSSEAATFATEINRCGGIGGRRFDLSTVDESGDPGADCLEATRSRPLAVVALATSPAAQCIVGDRQTVFLTESDASNAELGTSSGRLAATGSAEGALQARLLDLIASGHLDGRAVAVVAGKNPADIAFVQAARSTLTANRIQVVDVRRAKAVLEPMLDVATIPLLIAATAATRGRTPLDVYGFSAATEGALADVRREAGGDPARMLRTVNLFAFSPVTDPSYRASRSPNTFMQMCNDAYASASALRTPTTSTTLPTEPPLSATYLQVSDVCLAVRIIARAAFAAGPTADGASLVPALHRLPYLDQAAPSGTPKPRPNQVVNEAVRRIAQVVVLTQVQDPCPATSSTTTVDSSECWAPVSGWDDGGRVVNVPLSRAANRIG